jgi:hypothetical protein
LKAAHTPVGRFVPQLSEQGDLVAFDLRGVNSNRACVRIPRASVVSFLEARQIEATTGKRGDKHARKDKRVLARSGRQTEARRPKPCQRRMTVAYVAYVAVSLSQLVSHSGAKELSLCFVNLA